VSQPVVVVGAGPVGLVSALLLAARGVPSVVLERHRAPFGLPRAVHLDDEVVRILQPIGLAGEFLAVSRPALGLRVLDSGHRVVAEFARPRGAGRFGHPPANLFDQPDLEALLFDRVAASPLVTLRAGCTVTGIDGIDSLAPTVRFVDADGGAAVMEASAVLGCDGAGGLVAGAIGAEEHDLGDSQHWLVVDVLTERSLDTWGGVHQVSDPARAATYMQIGEHRHRWEFRLAEGEEAADLTGPEVLGELLRPWTGSSDLTGLTIRRSADYRYRAVLARPWRRGRVFLLGDAAHRTPPFIGQGLGAGLRDAANLTWKLAAVLTAGAREDLLATYEVERAPHARSLIRQALLLGRIMTGGGRGAAWVRRPAVAALGHVPGAAALLDRGSPPLRPGPLVAARRRPGALPGRLVPQPPLGGGRRLDDDVLGPGFAVLARAGAVPPAPVRWAAGALEARVVRLDELEAGGDVEAAALLDRWLRDGWAGAAVIRPDRTVLATADERGRLRGSGLRAVLNAADLLRPLEATPNTM
jgi:3-(3-hydroxy-phenyl)propionate hydroxylase